MAHLRTAIKPLPDEEVAAAIALNRIVAQDVIARLDVPRFDNAAMDGYAVRSDDCEAASAQRPVLLNVGQPAYAGNARAQPLRRGEAAPIGTGGLLPPGADAVVRREWTRRSGRSVEIACEVKPGTDVRRCAEDLTRGERVLRAGMQIGPAQLAAATGTGHVQLHVWRQPRVVVVLTGDEIAGTNERMRADQVPDAVGCALTALLTDAGCVVQLLGPVADNAEVLRDTLRRIRADLIVTVGGVSIGERDLLAEVAAGLGEATSWRLALRPGSPFIEARIGAIPLLGLPGNPAAALVSFEALVRPVVRRLLGLPEGERRLQAILATEISVPGGRLHYLRAHAWSAAGRLRARPLAPHGSGSIASLAAANAWIQVSPEVTHLAVRSTVDLVPMWSGWLDAGALPADCGRESP